MSFNTPILFVIFNRKDVAVKSFKKIKELRPVKLYIACDGARDSVVGEKKLVENTRKAILELIDWDCELKTLFQENNLGCGLGVYTAINWLFENEEKGIILEDDCVARESFFLYVEELLVRYKDDARIGMISGFNQVNSAYNDFSYTFSKYKACWGWGTWRRAWVNMDLELNWTKSKDYNSIISNMGYLKKDFNYWKYRLKLINLKQVSAWDWQWYFSLASNNQLTIFPETSLISNIGFGASATHTSFGDKKILNTKCNIKFPLRHPQYIVPNIDFDRAFYKKNNTLFYILMRFIPIEFKNFIKRLLNN